MSVKQINWSSCLILASLLTINLGCGPEQRQLEAEQAAAQQAAQSQAAAARGEGSETKKTIESKTTVASKYNPLTDWEQAVLVDKATERAFTGEYDTKMDPGTYVCRQCNAPLYHSEDKFDAHCGWPAFDDQIAGAVKRKQDADGTRVEILCENCGGHLGHVFEGEHKTAKNVRHCVNSISMTFVPKGKDLPATIILQEKE